MLYEEFWLQGDEERKLAMPLGFLNDRTKTNIGSAQVSFIEKFIEPSFEAFLMLLPKAKVLMDNVTQNKQFWKERIDHYAKLLKDLEDEIFLKK